MDPKDTSNEEIVEDLGMDETTPTVDDFIKELEEKEKSLEISSDLVIEVGDSEVEHENIHDSFVSDSSLEFKPLTDLATESLQSLKPTKTENDETCSELQENVAKLTSEKTELKESIQRRQRDFDNFRNRIERERTETYKNILGNLATKILPVLDNLHRALDSTENAEQNIGEHDLKTFFDGIVLVNQQLNEVLMEMGVQPISAVGEPFDPNIHEAVATEDTDEVPHKTVIQELLRGYRIDDRVIRASMVKVSSSQ